LARSPFGYGHDPAGRAARELRTVEPGDAVELHAAASRLIPASATKPQRVPALRFAFITYQPPGRHCRCKLISLC
jgi:hypothetical protein